MQTDISRKIGSMDNAGNSMTSFSPLSITLGLDFYRSASETDDRFYYAVPYCHYFLHDVFRLIKIDPLVHAHVTQLILNKTGDSRVLCEI